MTRRMILGVGLALVAAAAIPLGLPRVASATTTETMVFSPNPIAQAGALAASSVVDICVQPEVGGAHVADTVWLSFVAGKFGTSGGTAVVGTTPLSSTPQSFTPGATCGFTGGTAKDGVPVVYTSPSTTQTKGRDVITAADSAADSGSSGVCSPSPAVCNTDTYVFSPVASYVFTPTLIAATGTLTSGEQTTFYVTAYDNSTPTPQPVPGALLDLSLTSSGSGGSATAVNSIVTPPTTRDLTNSPQRVGATTAAVGSVPAGSVSITYTAGNTATASGTDTITAQDHPTATISMTTSYTYGTTTAPSSNPYTPVTPYRVCDTRPAGGGITANQCDTNSTGAGSGPIGSGLTRVITIGGFGTVPSTGTTAVVVNVTAVAPTVATYLEVYPDGKPAPGTSNLNPAAGEVVANLVEVGMTNGKIDVLNATGSINVVIDIEGYVSTTSTGLYTAASAPVRICDTRAPGGGVPTNRCNTSGPSPIGPGATLTFNVNGGGSPVPGTGVTAVVFNLTGIAPSVPTVLTAFTGTPRPLASNLNINPHTAVPNRVIVPVTCAGGNCTVSIWNGAGTINIAVDIDGWFSATGKSFSALAAPVRLCNTQNGNPSVQGCTKAAVAGGSANVRNLVVTGVLGIPSNATAIVANVTAVNATTSTYVTVFPGPLGASVPDASDINPTSISAVPNLVIVGVGSDGSINVFNAVGSVNFIVDVVGYYS